MNLEVKNLSFSYGKRQILCDISLSAREGEVLTILGANGAGKTTLFRCILGLLKNHTGEVLLDGENANALTPREAARRIAYIPQHSAANFHYRVSDMVLMGLTNTLGTFALPGKREERLVMETLERVGISRLADRSFLKLSGGEQQLVLLARALVQNAPVLMLDEPASGLDYGNQLLVQRQAKALAAEGYTIIQTSHHPEQSYLYSDKILALKGGNIFQYGTPGDILTAENIKELYNASVVVSSLFDDAARACTPAELIKKEEHS